MKQNTMKFIKMYLFWNISLKTGFPHLKIFCDIFKNQSNKIPKDNRKK